MLKMSKEEFLEKLYVRREAERYVELSNSAFQYHLRQGNISPCKESGTGKGRVQLFWKEDLDRLKEFLK